MPRRKGTTKWLMSRSIHLSERYSISEKDYERLLASQDYKCKICSSARTDKTKANLSVDHDHTNGKIRGLLCGNCNLMLGYAKDNKNTLLKAIQYLKGVL
jgi:hypothetical protein